MRRAQPLLLGVALTLAPFTGPSAAAPDLLPEAVRRIELVPGWRRADGAHVAAIAIELAPGWYTYWRAPGATGFPPQFDWTDSDNLASVAYEWPRPIAFDTYGDTTIAYRDTLVLPVALEPDTPGATIEATVRVFFGVCSDICIPAEAQLTARLDPGAPPRGRAEIERALAARPDPAAVAGIVAARCTLTTTATGYAVTAEIAFAAPPGGGFTTVFEAEERPDLWFGAAETRTEGRTLHATAKVGAAGAGPFGLDRGALRLTLIESDRAMDIRGCPAAH